MSPSQDLHFGLELADATARPQQFLGLLGRHTGYLAAVDSVLFDPVVDGGRGDVKIVGGLSDRPPRSHERDSSSSELRGIGRWHKLSLSLGPNFNKRVGNKTRCRSEHPEYPRRFKVIDEGSAVGELGVADPVRAVQIPRDSATERLVPTAFHVRPPLRTIYPLPVHIKSGPLSLVLHPRPSLTPRESLANSPQRDPQVASSSGRTRHILA